MPKQKLMSIFNKKIIFHKKNLGTNRGNDNKQATSIRKITKILELSTEYLHQNHELRYFLVRIQSIERSFESLIIIVALYPLIRSGVRPMMISFDYTTTIEFVVKIERK